MHVWGTSLLPLDDILSGEAARLFRVGAQPKTHNRSWTLIASSSAMRRRIVSELPISAVSFS